MGCWRRFFFCKACWSHGDAEEAFGNRWNAEAAFGNRSDAEAHDVLLCVKDNELVETQKGRGRGFRFGLENDEYYFKSKDEMISLLSARKSDIVTLR